MFKKVIFPFIAHLFFIATFISLFSFWLGDLFSHFRMFWTVFSVILFIIYIILFNQKKVRFIIVISVFFSLLINFISSYSFWTNYRTYEYLFFGSPIVAEYPEYIEYETQIDTTTRKLLLMNVLSSNTNYEKVRALIKNVDADFVVIIELNKNWEKELEELNENYPYKFTEVREDNFGMGIYSKKSFVESVLLDSVYNHNKAKKANSYSMTNPNIQDYINKQKMKEPSIYIQDVNQTTILIAHPFPPISPEAYGRRNNYLREISSVAAKKDKTLLVGDFNCSPFSTDYNDFLEQSGLRDDFLEIFGFQPTWNSAFPLLMQTQLDHVWHSEDIEILHRQTLPIEGSDHKAVLVVFEYTQENQNAEF